MAKYVKNNYFDGVVLPEPKEEALRRMAKGVKLGYGEKKVYSSSFNGTILTSPPIQIGTSDFSIEYYGNAYGSGSGAPLLFNKANIGTSNAPTYFQVYGLNLGRNALDWVTFGVPDGGNIATDSLNFNYLAPDLSTKFHLVITRQGRMINVYIDNTPVASKEQTEIKDLGAFVLGILNSSDVGFARVWNYALSAKEVATLYNDGDPAGYKLPSNYKGCGDVYHGDFSEGADDWHVVLTDYVTMTVADGVITISKEDERSNMNIARNHNPYASRVVNYFVRLEFAEPLPSEVGNIVARPFNSIVGVNLAISSDRLSASGTLISTIAKPNGGSMIIFQASGAISISISSISFTPAVCIAEYLPHNLIPTAEGSVVKWLDSAPRLPEANGILPPLDASVGGYDLAAIGNPKIII